MRPKEYILDNGMRFIACQNPNSRTVSTGFWVGIGSRYETDANWGICHLIEHLVFKGTKNYPTSKSVSLAIEGVGGFLNAMTGRELTAFYNKVPSRNWEIGVNILIDLLVNPLMREADIDKEREVVIEEISTRADNYHLHAYDLLSSQMWEGNRLGKSGLGTIESLKGIDKETIVDFMDQNYTPKNIVVSCVGNFDIREVKSLLENKFRRYSSNNWIKPAYTKVVKNQCEPKISVVDRDIAECHLCVGLPVMSRSDKRSYSMNVASDILGGGMSSRLFQAVREKRGLAYTVNSFLNLHTDAGEMAVYAGVGRNKTKEAFSSIVEELKKFRDEGVTNKEVSDAKNQYLGGVEMMLDDSLRYSNILGETALLEGRLLNIEEETEKVMAVTKDSIDEVSGQFINSNNLNLIIINPKKL